MRLGGGGGGGGGRGGADSIVESGRGPKIFLIGE